MSGRRTVYGSLGYVGQSWEENFDTAYGFDPFGENAFAQDVPNVGTSLTNPAAGSNWFDGLISSAEKLGTAWMGYEQARDIQQLNLELVRQGKEPISQADIAPQVRVGIAPDTQRMMMIGGIGLLALLAFGMMTRGK